jgi:hypothetical protein
MSVSGKRMLELQNLPCVFENLCSKYNAIILRSECPHNSHRASYRPDHAEIKDHIRQMEFVSSLPIELVNREMGGGPDEEENQEDRRDRDIETLDRDAT